MREIFFAKKNIFDRWKWTRNLGPFPPIGNIFFQFFILIFYTSKTIAKTLVHLILRTFAIFNPTYRALIAALIALNDEIETHSVS